MEGNSTTAVSVSAQLQPAGVPAMLSTAEAASAATTHSQQQQAGTPPAPALPLFQLYSNAAYTSTGPQGSDGQDVQPLTGLPQHTQQSTALSSVHQTGVAIAGIEPQQFPSKTVPGISNADLSSDALQHVANQHHNLLISQQGQVSGQQQVWDMPHQTAHAASTLPRCLPGTHNVFDVDNGHVAGNAKHKLALLAGQQQLIAEGRSAQQPHMCSSSSCSSLSGNTLLNSTTTANAAKSRLGKVTQPSTTAEAATAAAMVNAGAVAGTGAVTAHAPATNSTWALERVNGSDSVPSEWLGRHLRIHCCTFNMNSRVPSSIPDALLGPPGTLEQVDLFVFATQESGSITDWEKLLAARLGPAGFEKLAWQTLRAIHLVLFASPHFRQQVVAIQGSAVATGIGNLVGNKGAAALAVQLVDFKLLFVGSHFAAHDDKVERRNADFHRIKTGLFSSNGSSGNLSDLARQSGSGHGSGRSTPVSTGSNNSLREQRAFAAEATTSRSSSPSKLSARLPPVRAGWMISAGQGDALASHVGNAGTPGSLTPTVSDASEHSAASNLHECLTNELNTLRAASCPSQQSWPRPPGSIGTPSPPASPRGAAAALARGCWPGSMTASVMPLSAHDALNMSRPHSVAGTSAGAAGGGSGGGLNIAEEIRSQLSFFKSFVVRRPSVNLLGTRQLAGSGDVTQDYDVVFWAGDLNYRINGNARAIGYLMRARLHEVMHANDQLKLQQRKGRVFQGFQEGKVRFPPTFKFKPGTTEYSDQRVPSWTDRILWKVRETELWGDSLAPAVTQTHYDSVPEVTSSDHKPVVAGFEVMLSGVELPSVQADKHSLHSRCSIM